MNRNPEDLAPENDNAEQSDEGQAQDVAEDSLHLDSDPSEDSERGGTPNPAGIIPEDTPDLVDKMNEMLISGRIDNDAFVGEPHHDDEDDTYGDSDDDED